MYIVKWYILKWYILNWKPLPPLDSIWTHLEPKNSVPTVCTQEEDHRILATPQRDEHPTWKTQYSDGRTENIFQELVREYCPREHDAPTKGFDIPHQEYQKID